VSVRSFSVEPGNRDTVFSVIFRSGLVVIVSSVIVITNLNVEGWLGVVHKWRHAIWLNFIRPLTSQAFVEHKFISPLNYSGGINPNKLNFWLFTKSRCCIKVFVTEEKIESVKIWPSLVSKIVIEEKQMGWKALFFIKARLTSSTIISKFCPHTEKVGTIIN